MVLYRKAANKAQEDTFAIFTETEKIHLEESTRHNHDLFKRLAEL